MLERQEVDELEQYLETTEEESSFEVDLMPLDSKQELVGPIRIVLPREAFLEKVVALAQSKRYIPELSEEGITTLKEHQKYFKEGGASHDLSCDTMLLFYTETKIGKDALINFFQHDECIEKMGNRDYEQESWKKICDDQIKDVFYINDKALNARPFMRYMGYLFISAFHRRIPEFGLDKRALSLLGWSITCDANIDVWRIYNNAHNSIPWRKIAPRFEEYFCDPVTNEVLEPVEEHFQRKNLRAFVFNKIYSNVSEENMERSYLLLFSFYKSACQDEIDYATLELLQEAIQLNPNLAMWPCFIEGTRHYFSKVRGQSVSRALWFRNKEQWFENFFTKSSEERQKIFEKVAEKINSCQETAQQLQEKLGGIGFLESARLYFEIASFSFRANAKMHPMRCYDASFYFRKMLTCIYIAEFLLEDPLNAFMAKPYLDTIKKDAYFFNYKTARQEIVSDYPSRFSKLDFRVARLDAEQALKTSHPRVAWDKDRNIFYRVPIELPNDENCIDTDYYGENTISAKQSLPYFRRY